MLNDKQTGRMLSKLARYEQTLEPRIFTRMGNVELKRFETPEQYHSIPSDEKAYRPVNTGDSWGGEGIYCWFRGTATLPAEADGRNIYIASAAGGYEAMLWVNGVPSGIFANKILKNSHGNHYCNLLVAGAAAGQQVDIALEAYAGHTIIGTQPFETAPASDFRYTYEGVTLCIKNQDIADFIYDLATLNQLVEKMDPLSFRRADIINCLTQVHNTVYYAIDDVEETVWRPALAAAREIMKPVLQARNPESAPSAGIVGHSHMDTAWLWHIPETVKKCARTYSNQLSLMEQFPEYRFIQSSAYHGEVIRRNYPALFEKIKDRIEEGRYEPNGAVWVECDCNITSGEAMIRQFLWGQRFTQKQFNYTSNCFWLPDTFGYSAAIPQIMKGCRVDFFLTTKISWNDTNRFPYETFYWEGNDGTRVFAHFNTTHCWPMPQALLQQLDGRDSTNYLQNKNVAKRRLVAYGFGDGGGGPQFEMIEMARRVKDLDGCPKAEHVNVGEFMTELEKDAVNAPTYRGELYLELHRGTLTSQHNIKRNNRKAEVALHDLEFLTVRKAASLGAAAEDTRIRPLMETLLVNQFHDILPGTCIAKANDQCYREMGELLEQSEALIYETINPIPDQKAVTVINTLGFDRDELIYIEDTAGRRPVDKHLPTQQVEDLRGRMRLCVAGLRLPSLSGMVIPLEEGGGAGEPAPSAFAYIGDVLVTPFAKVTFAADGTIASFIDTRVNRELRGKGHPLNTFLMAEDVPTAWDNWDIDADCQMKFAADAVLTSRQVVSDGSIQFRIRSTYKLSSKSTLTQDMIFYSATPRVDFETVIDWNDKHRFLKVDFDTSLFTNTARHEIQFGHCIKPTTRNNSLEQAMFEVLQHKFTDLSETRYGVSILNDCKYGVSAEGSAIRLSLHKSGTRPDPRGDAGVHECVYSFLPHTGGFSSENVVLPAYSLNYRPLVCPGDTGFASFAATDAANIIIETVKPCEDNQNAFILRLYEAEGTFTHTMLSLGLPCTAIELTNMLEETVEELIPGPEAALTFRPFEIKTVKVSY